MITPHQKISFPSHTSHLFSCLFLPQGDAEYLIYQLDDDVIVELSGSLPIASSTDFADVSCGSNFITNTTACFNGRVETLAYPILGSLDIGIEDRLFDGVMDGTSTIIFTVSAGFIPFFAVELGYESDTEMESVTVFPNQTLEGAGFDAIRGTVGTWNLLNSSSLPHPGGEITMTVLDDDNIPPMVSHSKKKERKIIDRTQSLVGEKGKWSFLPPAILLRVSAFPAVEKHVDVRFRSFVSHFIFTQLPFLSFYLSFLLTYLLSFFIRVHC